MSRPGIDRVFERRVAGLVNAGEPQLLQGGAKGVEKESLRVLLDGSLAHTPHPQALGSALTNEHITTGMSCCGRPACRAPSRTMRKFHSRSTAARTSGA
jgi:glutamate--cysteine ligase